MKVTVIYGNRYQILPTAYILHSKLVTSVSSVRRINDPEIHVRTKHETERCSTCKKRFVTKNDLKEHMNEEHRNKCDDCEEEFYSEIVITEHMKDEHETRMFENIF